MSVPTLPPPIPILSTPTSYIQSSEILNNSYRPLNMSNVTEFSAAKLSENDNVGGSDKMIKVVPVTLKLASYSLGILALLSLSQFLLTFVGKAFIPGFPGFVGFISFGSLYTVARRICFEIKNKGYIE